MPLRALTIAFLAFTATASLASAQRPRSSPTIDISLPTCVLPESFEVLSPLPLPDDVVDVTSLPAAAQRPWRAWRAALHAEDELRAATRTPGSGPMAPETRARFDQLDVITARAEAPARDAIERSNGARTASTWLALAALRYMAAERRYLDAADAYDATLATCGDHCPDPPSLELTTPIEAETHAASGATPETPVGAWARYLLATMQEQAGDATHAEPLLRELVAAPGAPAALVAEGWTRLGQLAFDAGRWADAASAYTRAIDSGLAPDLAAHARTRLMRAQYEEGRYADVLGELSHLDPNVDPARLTQARELAVYALDGLGDPHGNAIPAGVPSSVAAEILSSFATRAFAGSSLTWARIALDAAQARDPSIEPRHAPLRAQIVARTESASTEARDTWTRRVVERCMNLHQVPLGDPQTLELETRVNRGRLAGAHVRVVRATPPAAGAWTLVASCLSGPTPPPENPTLVGTVRATVRALPAQH